MNIELQVLGSALRSIAEEMGAVLIRSAFSANIKERRDCSTALFDERGRMIAQAEHIPVHLGAMPDAVAAVMRNVEERLGGNGRLLVRYSGTEPLLRVMLEGQDKGEIARWAQDVVDAVHRTIGAR